MIRGILPLLVASALAASAQKYNGPVPPKPDLPFLKHADSLVPTEAVEAKEEKKKDDVTYVIPGANSSAKTPLAAPIFLFQADRIAADHLALYKMEVKNGRRELVSSPKKPMRAIRIIVSHLSGKLYKIEVDDSLEAGEYVLSPEGPNLTAFCFQVF
ncbi:MAG TPA: hypothetical protein VGH38_15720 [Bryobacteraceae bacterium]|jgi:hypothetical protein